MLVDILALEYIFIFYVWFVNGQREKNSASSEDGVQKCACTTKGVLGENALGTTQQIKATVFERPRMRDCIKGNTHFFFIRITFIRI